MLLNASKSEVWSASASIRRKWPTFGTFLSKVSKCWAPVGSEGFCQAVFAQKVEVEVVVEGHFRPASPPDAGAAPSLLRFLL